MLGNIGKEHNQTCDDAKDPKQACHDHFEKVSFPVEKPTHDSRTAIGLLFWNQRGRVLVKDTFWISSKLVLCDVRNKRAQFVSPCDKKSKNCHANDGSGENAHQGTAASISLNRRTH